MNRVVMVVSNAFRPDPRVYKEAKSLVEYGFRVAVYAWDRECKYPRHSVMSGIIVERIRIRSSYGNFFRFMITTPIFWLVVSLKILAGHVAVIHCHDFDTLPVGLIVKVLRRNIKLVYDAHEYYPAMVIDKILYLLYVLLRWIDRAFVRIVDCLIIPCEERRKLYEGAKKITVVPNTPKLVDIRREPLKGGFTIFYGGGLSEGNGILIVIKALANLQDTKLILAGDGPLRHVVERISKENININYLGFIRQEEVLEGLARADATFVFYKPTNINRIYAASNKLFEAMMVGVPVIINKEISPSDIVNKYDCGIVVPYGDIQTIRREIIRLKNDPFLRKRLGQNGKKAFRKRFSWDLLKLDFVNEYMQLLKQ